MSIDKLLSLRRELKIPFRLHPLGFIACVLLSEGPRKIRLHFWPVTGGDQQSPECQIHDHLFEFKSWVLSGEVQNIEYCASDSGIELSEYETQYIGNQSILLKTNRTLRLVEYRRILYCAGTSYTLSAGVLHETIRLGVKSAFTVLAATEVVAKHPLVLGPLNGADRYEYRREIVDETIAERLISGA